MLIVLAKRKFAGRQGNLWGSPSPGLNSTGWSRSCQPKHHTTSTKGICRPQSHPPAMAHSGPFHRFWGFPSQFLRGHMLSRVWVNIIMCDLRFFFLEGTTSWKFHRKEIENQGRAGCKNVKIHRSKCVKWELPKSFNCLRLCILLTTKIEPNKLSGFFFLFFFFF